MWADLDVLLSAFASALRAHFRAESAARRRRSGPHYTPLLVLKGLDALYGTGASVRAAVDRAFPGGKIRGLSSAAATAEELEEGLAGTDGTVDLEVSRFVEIVGEDLPSSEMTALYFASDTYVTASMAEAFQSACAGVGPIPWTFPMLITCRLSPSSAPHVCSPPMLSRFRCPYRWQCR